MLFCYICLLNRDSLDEIEGIVSRFIRNVCYCCACMRELKSILNRVVEQMDRGLLGFRSRN
jgi:hypothetical protein